MLKPLHVKISEEAFLLLDQMNKKTDVPKSRLVERGLRAIAKEYERVPKAMELLRVMESAEEDYQAGRTKTWKNVKKEIEAKLKSKMKKNAA